MARAGVDTTKYKAHSIISASSTKAVEKGVDITRVKQHANWSLRSNTFEKYYFKPAAQQNNSTKLINSIFSTIGENTTLTSEVKSTRIVEGTTNNLYFILLLKKENKARLLELITTFLSSSASTDAFSCYTEIN